MKFYTYGNAEKPVILLIPGTCCPHTLFDPVVPLLTERFYTIVASFSGFDENEDGVYGSMDQETEAIEAYITESFGGHIAACYGCSLGGSFAAYLVQRGNIRIDHAIIGSSDMDEAQGLSARLQAKIIANIMYKAIYNGGLPNWMKKLNEAKIKKHPEDAAYRRAFAGSFFPPELTGGRVKKESIYNQFYSDLVTKIEDNISRDGTTIHVFYAAKMGEKYEARYKQHFSAPDIRRHEMNHEELLFCYPEKWAAEVFDCCGMEEKK